MRKRLALTAIAGAVLALATTTVVTTATATAAPAGATVLPKVIPLSDGFRPEGIATGRGTEFFVGSQVDGAICRSGPAAGSGRCAPSP